MLETLNKSDSFIVWGLRVGLITLNFTDKESSIRFIPSHDYIRWSENLKIYLTKKGAKPRMTLYVQEQVNFLNLYDVIDCQTGGNLGTIRYHFGQWEILDKNDNYFVMSQENMVKEIFSLKSYPYCITDSSDRIYAKILRTSSVFCPWYYRYDVDFSMDKGKALNRRLALALIIMYVLNAERKLTLEKIKAYFYTKMRRSLVKHKKDR
jgi:hypothetical protein